jgi:hypothetical protein
MRVYVGQTRAHALIEVLEGCDFGECVNRADYEARRHPWFFDNGAFMDHRAGRKFDAEAYEASFARHASSPAPDFVVLPDIVGGGRESLEFSFSWYARVRELCLETWGEVPPIYVAVQDGMSREDIDAAIDFGDGVFVGGTLEWKIAAAPGIIRRARGEGSYVESCPPAELPKPVHIGRVGSGRRIVWARLIGADSVDSCLPLREFAKVEIAAHASSASLLEAVGRFGPGASMAAEAVAGLVRRSFLRGDLEPDAVRDLGRIEELAYRARVARKEGRS